MSNRQQKTIKAIPLCTDEKIYESEYESYSEEYDYIIQEIQRDLESRFTTRRHNSTYDRAMGHCVFNEDTEDGTDWEELEPIIGVPGPTWKALFEGTGKERTEHKAQVIAKWTAQDAEKDKRVKTSRPFATVPCLKCGKSMKYDWTIMYDRGTKEKPEEYVMHFYICSDKCGQKEGVFEDGIRWSANSGGRCFFCQSVRTTTVTKDASNNIFLIHRCARCNHSQVEEKDKENKKWNI